jgi:hypothetical protein
MRTAILMILMMIMMLFLAVSAIIGGGWLISCITGFGMLASTALYTLIWVGLVIGFFITAVEEE